MNKIILVIAICFQSLMALNSSQVVEMAEPNTFRVVVPLGGDKYSTGTGFIINKDGYVITNNHVVHGVNGNIFLKNKFKKYRDVILIKTYPKRDLAILKINNYTKGTFLKLQEATSIKKGQKVFPLGFPGAADILEGLTFNASFSEGIISKIDHDTSGHFIHNYALVQIDAVINKGNSGGPLLNKNCSVVGINTLGNAKKGVQGIFWSIHIQELIKTLKENNISYTLDTKSLEEVDPTIAVNENGNSVKKIWIILGVIVLLLLIIVLIVVKNKKAPAEIDERELSKLVKAKIQKHTPIDSQNNEVIPEPDEPANKTSMMSISLVPNNLSFPEINNAKKKEITIGRSDKCDVVIDSSGVSRKHLKLLMQGSLVEVTDLSSANGTYIDGMKLTAHKPYLLEVGQNLVIGGEEVVYSIKSSKNMNKNSFTLACGNNNYPNITKSGIVGRDASCDTVIENANVSRQHLKIEGSEGKVLIADLGSANGTYLDGIKLEQNDSVELQAGQKLIIGSEDVVYQLADG